MPKVVFSPEDEALIEELLERYDPERNPEMARLADKVPADDWAFFVEYTRRDLRHSAQMFMIAKGVVRTAIELGLANRAGGESLLREEWIAPWNLGEGWEAGSKDDAEATRYSLICDAYPDKVYDSRGRLEDSVMSDTAGRFYDAIREAILADVFTD